MQFFTGLRKSKFIPVLVLIFVSALAYLPRIAQLTFYRDDWYFMADRYFGGADIYHQMFWIDRPIRAYLYELLYQLFGLNVLPYNLLAYFWRLLSGVLCYWLFMVIWPNKRKVNLWIAVLFTLYPGYLWWVSGIEYQPYILGLCLQIFSIILSLLAIAKPFKTWLKIGLIGAAILFGWLYTLVVDFAIGIELFRLVCVILLLHRMKPEYQFAVFFRAIVRSWTVYLLIPAGFFAWRAVFFQNRRPETDIALQLAGLKSDFWGTIGTWNVNSLESFYNVTIRGWFYSVSENFFGLEPKVMAIVLLFALIGMAILIFTLQQPKSTVSEPDEKVVNDQKWPLWTFFGGVIGVWGTIVPIVLMNRTISLADLSHYTLSGSLPAAMLLVTLVTLVKSEKIQFWFLAGLASLSIAAQQSLQINVITEGQKIQAFWQQVALRIPELEPGTTVIAHYPAIEYGDDYDVVWGPLNFVYLDLTDAEYHDGGVHYPYSGLKQNYLVSKDVIVGASEGDWYRTHAFVFDYQKLLVLDQPTSDSCVHVLDARWARLTLTDSDQMLLLAGYSNIGVINNEAAAQSLNPVIFGNPISESWCIYYQQAEQALQQENWSGVIDILHQAKDAGFSPADRVEWMPFLQAALYLEDQTLVGDIAGEFTSNKFLRDEACRLIPAMRENGYEISPSMTSLGRTLFCDQVP